MNTRATLRVKDRNWGLVLATLVVTPAMLLSPIFLGHYVMGTLPLSAGLLYGLVLPLALLFGVCLIKFSWEVRIIMTVCVGGLFLFSVPVMKKLSSRAAQAGGVRG